MSITISLGKAGRLVIPKLIRETLNLREGTRLRLEVSGGKFEAVPEPDDVTIEVKDGFPVILGGPRRTKGQIVRALKADRDARPSPRRSKK